MTKNRSKITTIFEAEPQSTESKIESPDLDLSDFEDIEELPHIGEEAEDGGDNEGDTSQPAEASSPSLPEEEAEEVKAEEVDDENLTAEERETKDRIARIKKEVAASLLDPETAIALMDMILSRAGTIGNKSTKEDWKLDEDEREIFQNLLSATMEEEGMAFWPAKWWIVIAILFIYGMKGFDVWDDYYSPEALAEEEKEKKSLEEKEEAEAKETAATTAAAKKKLEELEERVQIDRKIKELTAELKAHHQNGSEVPQEAPESSSEEIEEGKAEIVDEEATATEEEEEPPVKIDPEERANYRYVYDNAGNLKYNENGTPKKRRGRKPGAEMGARDNEGKFIKA